MKIFLHIIYIYCRLISYSRFANEHKVKRCSPNFVGEKNLKKKKTHNPIIFWAQTSSSIISC